MQAERPTRSRDDLWLGASGTLSPLPAAHHDLPTPATPRSAHRRTTLGEMAHERDVVDRMRVVSRQLNSLAYARGGGVGRMSFDDIIEVAQRNGLFAWLLSDDVTDERDGALARLPVVPCGGGRG